MVVGPRVVCRGGQVRHLHATCGMCRVPRARRAPAPSERLAMDTRLISVEVLEPQLRLVGYAWTRACMFASRGLSSTQQTCRVCASAALAPFSPLVATAAFQVATNAAHRE